MICFIQIIQVLAKSSPSLYSFKKPILRVYHFPSSSSGYFLQWMTTTIPVLPTSKTCICLTVHEIRRFREQWNDLYPPKYATRLNCVEHSVRRSSPSHLASPPHVQLLSSPTIPSSSFCPNNSVIFRTGLFPGIHNPVVIRSPTFSSAIPILTHPIHLWTTLRHVETVRIPSLHPM